MKLNILFIALVSGLSAWTPVKSEVTHIQHREDNLLVMVQNDTWQPENFKNGLSIPAA